MRVLNVEHRDVHVILEFSSKQLLFLRKLLEHAKIDYNGEKEPEMKQADEYLQGVLYPLLEKLEADFFPQEEEE